MRTSPGEMGSILDAGAAGLTRLTEHLPFLHALGYATDITVADVRARYDEQRALSVPALADDAAASRALAESLGRRIDDQRRLLQRLDEAWDGPAADRARADLTATIACGVGLCTSLTGLAVALETAVAEITDAVHEKARIVGDLAGRTVDGRTSDDIETIVAGASGGAHGPTPDEAARWFGNPSDEATVDPAAECRRWLEERLVPVVLGALDAVLLACAEAGRRVAGTLEDLATSTERAAGSAEAAVGMPGPGTTIAPPADAESSQDGSATTDRADGGAAVTVPGARPVERKRDHAAGPVGHSGDGPQDGNDESGGVVLAEAGPL